VTSIVYEATTDRQSADFSSPFVSLEQHENVPINGVRSDEALRHVSLVSERGPSDENFGVDQCTDDVRDSNDADVTEPKILEESDALNTERAEVTSGSDDLDSYARISGRIEAIPLEPPKPPVYSSDSGALHSVGELDDGSNSRVLDHKVEDEQNACSSSLRQPTAVEQPTTHDSGHHCSGFSSSSYAKAGSCQGETVFQEPEGPPASIVFVQMHSDAEDDGEEEVPDYTTASEFDVGAPCEQLEDATFANGACQRNIATGGLQCMLVPTIEESVECGAVAHLNTPVSFQNPDNNDFVANQQHVLNDVNCAAADNNSRSAPDTSQLQENRLLDNLPNPITLSDGRVLAPSTMKPDRKTQLTSNVTECTSTGESDSLPVVDDNALPVVQHVTDVSDCGDDAAELESCNREDEALLSDSSDYACATEEVVSFELPAGDPKDVMYAWESTSSNNL
jgi:hypothetical protein